MTNPTAAPLMSAEEFEEESGWLDGDRLTRDKLRAAYRAALSEVERLSAEVRALANAFAAKEIRDRYLGGTMSTTQSPLSLETLRDLRAACARKFLVDLGGEVRLGRGELLALLDAYAEVEVLRRERDEIQRRAKELSDLAVEAAFTLRGAVREDAAIPEQRRYSRVGAKHDPKTHVDESGVIPCWPNGCCKFCFNEDGSPAAIREDASIPRSRPAEATCEKCQRPNVWSWHAPSPLWNAVMRDRETGADRYGIVCPPCFEELAREVIGRAVWCFKPHDMDVRHLWEDSDGREWSEAECRWILAPVQPPRDEDGDPSESFLLAVQPPADREPPSESCTVTVSLSGNRVTGVRCDNPEALDKHLAAALRGPASADEQEPEDKALIEWSLDRMGERMEKRRKPVADEQEFEKALNEYSDARIAAELWRMNGQLDYAAEHLRRVERVRAARTEVMRLYREKK